MKSVGSTTAIVGLCDVSKLKSIPTDVSGCSHTELTELQGSMGSSTTIGSSIGSSEGTFSILKSSAAISNKSFSSSFMLTLYVAGDGVKPASSSSNDEVAGACSMEFVTGIQSVFMGNMVICGEMFGTGIVVIWCGIAGTASKAA